MPPGGEVQKPRLHTHGQQYKFWYSGGEEKLYGVGIMMRAELAYRVIEIERYDDRIMKTAMVIGQKIWNNFSICAPQL